MRATVAICAALAATLVATRAQAQCASDAECKDGRVCSSGTCVSPSCTKDSECPGEAICDRGICKDRSAPPPAAAPAPPVVGLAPPIAAAPRPDRGRLTISSEWPGVVSVDGSEHGKPPLELTDLDPGPRRVAIRFDEGGARETKVYVRAGEVATVHLEPSSARRAGVRRRGAKLGGAVGGNFNHDFSELAGGGGYGEVVFNYGIVPAVDFRSGVELLAGTHADHGSLHVGVPVRFAFNLGSVYTMMVGGALGYYSIKPAYSYRNAERVNVPQDALRSNGFWFGPELSVLCFRFGSARQFEIAFKQGMLLMPGVQRYEEAFAGEADAYRTELRAAYHQELYFTFLVL